MFDLKEWIKTGIVQGYRQNIFSLPYVTTTTANYMVAGLLTEQDARKIAEACAAWDEEQAAARQPETQPETDAEAPEIENPQPEDTAQPAEPQPEEPTETEETA